MQECLRRRFLHRQAVERVGVGAGSSYVLLRVPWSKEFFVAVTVIRLDILAGPAQTLQERHKSDLGRDFIILNLIC